jgi:ribosome-associated heat shock protein Hsp15
MKPAVRIDKWLWSVRIFKTRSKATDACRKGKVTVDGQEVKPSREVREGDEVSVRLGTITKSLKVLKAIENRVSPRLAEEAAGDLTPQEEYDKLKKQRELNAEYRPKGLGRPTKKHRRLIDFLKQKK